MLSGYYDIKNECNKSDMEVMWSLGKTALKLPACV